MGRGQKNSKVNRVFLLSVLAKLRFWSRSVYQILSDLTRTTLLLPGPAVGGVLLWSSKENKIEFQEGRTQGRGTIEVFWGILFSGM